LFEFALGRPETAEKAILPLIALLTVSYAVILIISIIRRR
jgi:hypothetical protein